MRVDGLSEADRLRLAKLLVARPDSDLLTRLLTERQVKVHLYSIADQAKLVAELNEPGDAAARTASRAGWATACAPC
jgi:hypothetical protein